MSRGGSAALGRRLLLGLLGLMSFRSARAEAQERLAIFPDSALVVSVRPVALGAALRRLGGGWDELARHALPVAGSVSPLEASAIATTGIDPAGVAWFGLRALRGGVHLRVTIPLASAGMANALVSGVASATGLMLTRGAQGDWGGRAGGGEPVLARLDGDLLVLDLVLPGPTASASAADLARIVPIRPPRPWRRDRGLAARMGPSDGLALWADLALASRLALVHEEDQLTLGLKGLAPALHAERSRAAREALGTCKLALNAATNSFDELRLALVVRGPDELGLELALGGPRAALDRLRARVVPTALRSLGGPREAGEVHLQLHAPLPILLPGGSSARRPHVELPEACPLGARVALALRAWPTLRGEKTPLWAQVLARLRAAVIDQELHGGTTELVALAEVEPAARELLDRFLGDEYAPTSPLRLGARSLQTWAVRGAGGAAGEGRIVVIEPPAAGSGQGTLLGNGSRELIRARLERLGSSPAVAVTPLASGSLGGKGLRWLFPMLWPTARAELVDGVGRLEARLLLDPDLVRLDANLALDPARAAR